MLFANPDRKTLRILIDTLGDLPDTDARLHATREIRRLIAVVSDYERRQLPMISDEPIEFNMRTAPQEIGEGVELLAALKKQEIHLALPPRRIRFQSVFGSIRTTACGRAYNAAAISRQYKCRRVAARTSTHDFRYAK